MTEVTLLCGAAGAGDLIEKLKAGGFRPVTLENSDNAIAGIVLIDLRENAEAVLEKAVGLTRTREISTIAVISAPDMSFDLADWIDDFIVAPFKDEEFWLRLERLAKNNASRDMIKIDGLTIHSDSYEVLIDGRPLQLTYKEHELLKFLATHQDRVWTRQVLLNQIWEYDYFGGTRTVDVHIRRLRAKLGRYAGFIKTIRQVGYKFNVS